MIKLKSPRFWHKNLGVRSSVLYPFSAAYSFLNKLRYKTVNPYVSNIPVICVGNIVMGGAGKTPLVIKISNILKNEGFLPHIVSRGYGGYLSNTLVNHNYHNYMHVGDEAILLSKEHPTWVGKDRVHLAKSAMNLGANIIVMDDGFQNPSIKKNCSIVVINSEQGIGNGLVFPAGPLRESFQHGIERADCVVIVGEEFKDKNISYIKSIKKPIFFAKTELKNEDERKGEVVAFTGLGFPEKFKNFLINLGYSLRDFIIFPDHHPYTQKDMQRIFKSAEKYKAKIVTTEKDYTRLPYNYNKEVHSIVIKLSINEEQKFLNFLKKQIEG